MARAECVRGSVAAALAGGRCSRHAGPPPMGSMGLHQEGGPEDLCLRPSGRFGRPLGTAAAPHSITPCTRTTNGPSTSQPRTRAAHCCMHPMSSLLSPFGSAAATLEGRWALGWMPPPMNQGLHMNQTRKSPDRSCALLQSTEEARRRQIEAKKRAQRRQRASMRGDRALDEMIANAVARDTR